LIDIASSGMSGGFTVTNGNPGTAAALADSIAQRVATIVRISEPIRNCNDERKKSQFARARAEAMKALAIDRNSTSAHLCLATVYDRSGCPTACWWNRSGRWRATVSTRRVENIFRIYQQRNDTTRMVDALIHQLRGGRATCKSASVSPSLRR